MIILIPLIIKKLEEENNIFICQKHLIMLDNINFNMNSSFLIIII